MSKTTDSLNAMQQRVLEVAKERDWDKFQTLKNMALALNQEVAEVLEHFLWVSDEQVLQDKNRIIEISQEMADVLGNLLILAKRLDVDLSKAFWEKMDNIDKKYPADKIKGKTSYEFKRERRS